MKKNPVPAWDDRNELLRALSGDWQAFTQPLSQPDALQLADYVRGGLLAYQFEVEVTVIDDPRRVLRLWVVVSGDYAHDLQPFIEHNINKLLPPGTWASTVRRLRDLRRTARGAWFVENGFPMAELTFQPPALHVSDASWEERVEQASGENHVADLGNSDVVEYQGLQLNLQTRRLIKVGEDTGVGVSVVQVAILKLLFKNRESWLSGAAIEDAINHAKTKPGQDSYRSEDPNIVNRNITKLRKILEPFDVGIANDRHFGYQIKASANPPKKRQRKKTGSSARRRKEDR